MKSTKQNPAIKGSRSKRTEPASSDGKNDDRTATLHSETLNWAYLPTIHPELELQPLIEKYLDARKELSGRLAGFHFQALKDNFRDLIGNAENDGLHIIYDSIQSIINRDLDLIVAATDPHLLAWPVTVELMTQPSPNGYDITAMFFRREDGRLEIISLKELPPNRGFPIRD
jgi:hypothetical protein